MNAMLICERVIREEGTGLISLINVFEHVNSGQFPLAIPVAVYAKLTDADGEYEFKLELVRRDDAQVVGEFILGGVTMNDPMEHGEIVFQIFGIPLERPGYYDFRLWANGRFVDSKAIHARLVQSGEEAQP